MDISPTACRTYWDKNTWPPQTRYSYCPYSSSEAQVAHIDLDTSGTTIVSRDRTLYTFFEFRICQCCLHRKRCILYGLHFDFSLGYKRWNARQSHLRRRACLCLIASGIFEFIHRRLAWWTFAPFGCLGSLAVGNFVLSIAYYWTCRSCVGDGRLPFASSAWVVR